MCLAFHGCADALSVLLRAEPGLIGICDSAGSTPLHEAVKSQNFQVFQGLIKYGAEVGQSDGAGLTILHVAAMVGNLAVVQYVVKNKLIHFQCRDNYGATPLVFAQRNKMESIIGLLHEFKEEQ